MTDSKIESAKNLDVSNTVSLSLDAGGRYARIACSIFCFLKRFHLDTPPTACAARKPPAWGNVGTTTMLYFVLRAAIPPSPGGGYKKTVT